MKNNTPLEERKKKHTQKSLLFRSKIMSGMEDKSIGVHHMLHHDLLRQARLGPVLLNYISQ